jgi:hypothetical protein
MRSPTVSTPVEKLFPSERPVDPEIAERVGQEIIQNRLEPAAWATALAGGGKRQDALAAYARIRMQQISTERRIRREKAKSFEARRLTTCLGIKTVQDLLQRSNRGGQLNLIKPRLSMVWLGILLVGSAGAAASVGRLLGDLVPDRLEPWVPAMALLCGLAAVGGVLVLRAFLPKRWVMLGWNTGFTAVCTLACFASLCFGAKLIARTSPDVIRRLAGGPAIQATPVAVPAVAPAAAPEPARLVVKPNIDATAANEVLEEGE